MNPIVITVEKTFCDIDSLACAVAYRELLEKTDKAVVVFIPGELNYSVGKMADGVDLKIEKTCPAEVESFVIVDVSNPDKFHSAVNLEKISEVFDHHPNFEKFWAERIGDRARIEPIGACATLIWEAFKKAGIEKEISTLSANLLSAAILSNTRNFKSPNTSPRDHDAFNELKTFIDLPENWVEKYYADCNEKILDDLGGVLKDDTKTEQIPGTLERLVIGQLEIAEPKDVLEKRHEVEMVLSNIGSTHWMLNLTSLSGKENYFFTKDPETQKFLKDWQGVEFDENGVADLSDKMVIRKLIVKELEQRPWK